MDVIVALRKESVDRNAYAIAEENVDQESLSARRAWIEIRDSGHLTVGNPVALRKESVDRNINACNRAA